MQIDIYEVAVFDEREDEEKDIVTEEVARWRACAETAQGAIEDEVSCYALPIGCDLKVHVFNTRTRIRYTFEICLM